MHTVTVSSHIYFCGTPTLAMQYVPDLTPVMMPTQQFLPCGTIRLHGNCILTSSQIRQHFRKIRQLLLRTQTLWLRSLAPSAALISLLTCCRQTRDVTMCACRLWSCARAIHTLCRGRAGPVACSSLTSPTPQQRPAAMRMRRTSHMLVIYRLQCTLALKHLLQKLSSTSSQGTAARMTQISRICSTGCLSVECARARLVQAGNNLGQMSRVAPSKPFASLAKLAMLFKPVTTPASFQSRNWQVRLLLVCM